MIIERSPQKNPLTFFKIEKLLPWFRIFLFLLTSQDTCFERVYCEIERQS